jgi:hypothetical protein
LIDFLLENTVDGFFKIPFNIYIKEDIFTKCENSYTIINNCNHKILGIYYISISFIYGIYGTLLSIIIRLELISSGNIIINPDGISYINSASPGNKIATEGHIDGLIGDVTVNGSAGNTIKDRIDSAINNLIDGAPGLLNTLNEIAAAINDDENYFTTVTNAINTKQDSLTAGDGIDIDIDENISVKLGTGFDFDGSGNVVFATSYGVRKYTSSVGDATATSFQVNHALNTKDVTVQVFQNTADYGQVEVDVEHTNVDYVTIKFASAPAINEYRVVVIG